MYKNDINGIWTTKDEVEFIKGLGMHGVGRDGDWLYLPHAMDTNASNMTKDY